MTTHRPRYEGLLGFREVAGLRTVDGGVMRPGVLYRSGTPQFLTEDAAQALVHDTGIASTIDLRLQHEADREGRGPLDALGVPHLRHPFVLRGLVAADSAVAPMPDEDPLVTTYLGYLDADAAAVVQVIAELTAPGVLPTLVHCTLGKDRTGVAVALALAAVGVRREEIAAEFAAGEHEIAPAMERLRTMPSYADAIDLYPHEAWYSPPDVMERYLAGVDERYGGIHRLLATHGIDAPALKRLRKVLIQQEPEEPQ